ncbi:MAG: O-antigen ligase family protein [Bacteroidales bacterium]|nr:O-antigen ligase family protein [Bacteroidales bacterium]
MYIYTRQFHSTAYYITLVLLVMSLPLSRFTMSVFQFTLLGLWIWSGFSFEIAFRFFRKTGLFMGLWYFLGYIIRLARTNFIDKLSVFFRNRVAIVFVSMFLLHLIGLIHTSDFSYALKDLRTKLPILLLPIVMCTMEKIPAQKVKLLLIFYVLAVFAGTLFGLIEYLKQEFTDIRQISVFINPIRFSLNIVFSVFILIWFVLYDKSSGFPVRMAFLLLIIWLITFLIILESAIGMLSLFLIIIGLLLVKVFMITNIKLRLVTAVLLIGLPLGGYFYLTHVIHDLTTAPIIDHNSLNTHTALGNTYVHDTIHFGIEDGKYVGLYMSLDELETAWNERSKIHFKGRDNAGQEIMYTLIRFMTSKGLRKDAGGLAQMTDKEVQMVENGIANINYVTSPSLRTRVSKILLGYSIYTILNNPNGSSVMQRVEYLKASYIIIKENFWIGVGTGDLPNVFRETYEKMESPLQLQWRWRSHNQYLSIFIAFGVFGFLWFMFTLFYPFLKAKQYKSYFHAVFFALLLLSMLTEDTIESQDGVTLFAFFSAFFLFANDKDQPGRKKDTEPARLSEKD